MANFVYDTGKNQFAKALTDPIAATLKVMLLKSTHTPNQGGHHFVSDIVADEISVGGYARQTLTTKSVVEDDVNHFAFLKADPVIFTALVAGQTVGAAVLFRDTGSAATSPLLAYYDVADTPTNGGDQTINWNSDANGGVLKLG
jgi:hypothetical protein